MNTLTESYFLLPAVFLVVALVYSSVGLGGGSTYTAIMALTGMSTVVIPMISLSLNIIVTTVGSYHFLKNNHGRFKLILPFLISSIPAAYIGGALKLPKQHFYFVLLFSLIFVAFRIYCWRETSFQLNLTQASRILLSIIVGGFLGIIAGISGIGGGIYLVPLIIILGLGTQKEAAACGAVFIWLNSVSGLIARFQFNAIDLKPYIFLLFAVLIGGFAGSFLGAVKFSSKTMEKALGLIIIVAILFLGKKITNL